MSSELQMSIYDLLVTARDPSENKHGGNELSKAAHEKVLETKTDSYRRIMALLKARGEFGATSKEIAAAFGVQLNRISGRFSEMKAMGWIKDSGARREGAAVLVTHERG